MRHQTTNAGHAVGSEVSSFPIPNTGRFLRQNVNRQGLTPSTLRGLNGSVSGVNAPAIAAIVAADLSGTFEQAATVSKIASLLVAYDPTGGGTYQAGDGFIRAAKFDPAKDLVSLDPNIVSSASLTARTAPFVNP